MFFVAGLYYLKILSLNTIPIAVGAGHAYELVNMIRKKKTNVFLETTAVVITLMNLPTIHFILILSDLMKEVF